MGQYFCDRIHRCMIFEIQGAQDELARTAVEFEQRRIGEVELAFENGPPATVVRFLDGCGTDAVAITPMPTGIGLARRCL